MNIQEVIFKSLDDDKWYFWDECWAECEGPYETEKKCREALDKYYKKVLGR